MDLSSNTAERVVFNFGLEKPSLFYRVHTLFYRVHFPRKQKEKPFGLEKKVAFNFVWRASKAPARHTVNLVQKGGAVDIAPPCGL
jgi:hypothetical protein